MKAALALAAAFAAACLSTPVSAQKSYGPGVTDTEIKIGNTMPYSGPASPLGITGRVISAYFDEINEKGGVNGRKLNLISLDDAFSPPKTMEAARRLVEGDGVAFIFATMGTAPSSAISKYLNSNKVPQLFLISSASKWNDPANMPWSMALPWAPNYTSEAAIDVAYARAKNPNARFAVLYQNDDAGKEYLRGVKEALGADADKAIALASSFEVADPTVDSQVSDARQHQGRRLPDLLGDAARLRAGRPQGARGRLAAAALHRQRLCQQGDRDGAGGPRGRQGRDVARLAETLRRDAEGRSGDDRLYRLHEEAPAQRRHQQRRRALRLHHCRSAGRGAEAVQGQSDAREHHGAGFEPEERAALAA